MVIHRICFSFVFLLLKHFIYFFIPEDDQTMGLIIGEPNFNPKETYIWKISPDVWKDANKLQNSIYCSLAAYEKTPFHFLSNNSSNHNINEVIVVGKYFLLGNNESNNYTRTVMALDGNTMYIAFKGSDELGYQKLSSGRVPLFGWVT